MVCVAVNLTSTIVLDGYDWFSAASTVLVCLAHIVFDHMFPYRFEKVDWEYKAVDDDKDQVLV